MKRLLYLFLFLLIASNAVAFDFPWGADRWQGAAGAATPTYDMTLAIVGDSTLTTESIGYTSSGSPYTILGLSGLVDMGVTYGGTDDTTVFTGTDSGDVTGSTPSFSIDMDADKSLTCTFSAAVVGCSGNYGNTTEEAVTTYSLNDQILLFRVPVGCSGTISSISIFAAYISLNTRKIEFGIYEDNGSGTDPGDLIGNYGSFYDATINATEDWAIDSTISESITGDPDYIWVGVAFESSTTQTFYDNSGTNLCRLASSTFGTWPTTWPTTTDTEYTRDSSCYITF